MGYDKQYVIAGNPERIFNQIKANLHRAILLNLKYDFLLEAVLDNATVIVTPEEVRERTQDDQTYFYVHCRNAHGSRVMLCFGPARSTGHFLSNASAEVWYEPK
ncbi:MAG TPA: hypothetical protein VD907_05645 [Verrucomicrobiae bacterium]|nr:hypothetical protein [Verrucomicrobiae bacterium]